MALWMVYLMLIALLFGLGALALERGIRLYGGPTRWLWLLALVGSLVLPAVVWSGVWPPSGAAAPVPAAGVVLLEPITLAADGAVGLGLGGLDAPLSIAWGLASLALLAVLGASLLRLRRRRRDWRPGVVDGVRVLFSRRTGPAVIGLTRGAIVVPGWVRGLDRRLRRLLLAHEREHLRVGDHRLLLAAAALLVLMPWNPVLWWQLRRLRLAVEIDCDARVLHRRADPAGYGTLLLEVGRRRSGGLLPGAAFLLDPPSFLERRIRTMTRPTPNHRFPHTLGYAALAALFLAMACEAPAPEQGGVPVDDAVPTSPAADGTASTADEPTYTGGATTYRRGSRTAVSADEPTFTPYEVAPDLLNRHEVVGALERYYPPLLRDAGIGGNVLVWFFIDEDGVVRETQLRESSGHEALDEAALKVADSMEFSPALNGDERVKVWVSMPITFSLE